MTDLMDRLEARLGEVGTKLTAAAGGQALCRLDGQATSAKELEGRMALLLEVRRAVRADPQVDLSAIADKWRVDLAVRQERGASPAWISYLTGGLAETGLLAG
ncbi:MAG TPA: hypothetical protein VES03_03815 [Motilibacterales bacterium]|nr:hypothetical protein [Motilibacterales bacterium]